MPNRGHLAASSHTAATRTGASGQNPSIATPLLPDGCLHVSAAPHPFRTARADIFVPEGLSIAEIIERVQPDAFLRMGASVFIGDWKIEECYWRRTYPKQGHLISVRITVHGGGGGGGGKNPMRTIMQIAVLAGAAAFGGPLAASLGLKGFWVGSTFFTAASIGSAIIGIAGHLLINAIAPPPQPKLSRLTGTGSARRESQYFAIEAARNRVPKFEPIPRVLGRYRMYPDKIGEYTEILGDDQYYRVLLSFGYGPLRISDLRIGNTLLSNYEGVEYEIRQGFDNDAPLTLFTTDPVESQLAIELRQDGGWKVQTTAANADEISVDIAFPQGLVRFAGNGTRQKRTVKFQVDYAVKDSGAWKNAGFIEVEEARPSEIRRGLRWKVARGQYDVRMKRLTADDDSDQVFDNAFWITMRSFTIQAPVQFSKPTAQMALRIKASGQLNGVVDTINALAESILPVYDGAGWSHRAVTSNPAALIREIFQGRASRRPVADGALDLDSFAEFYEDCAQNGYGYNGVIDYQSSVWEMAQEIAGAARASISRPDGRIKIVMDRERETPVQHVTPRNSWGFEGEIIYPDLPHAFRCRFANEDKDFKNDERTVYDDGYDENSATEFRNLEFPGITDSDLVWKHGRFHIAQARLRREKFSVWMDFENFTCTRGDLVLLTHDVISQGLASARVKSVTDNGTHATAIVIDEEVAMETGKTYAIEIRTADEAGALYAVTTVNGAGQTTLTFATPIPLASAPAAGDLLAFGETGQVSREVIVTWIETGADFTAKLHFIDHAPAVYAADTSEIPEWTSNVAGNVALNTPAVQSVRSDGSVLVRDTDGSLNNRILLTYRKPSTLQTDIISVEGRFRETGSTGPWLYVSAPAAQGELSLVPVQGGGSYEYQVRYALRNGDPGEWTALATHLVIGKEALPGNITNLRAQQNGNTVTMRYTLPPDLDLEATELRYIKAS